MATVDRASGSLIDREIELSHPYWLETFRPELRFQQLEDDRQAWTGVTGILLTIVTGGALLALISVAICIAGT